MNKDTDRPSPEQQFVASYIENKLVEYVTKRGIPMPFYTNGSKITEEAQELRDALVAYLANRSENNLSALKEEVADVVITAAVAAHQAKFTVEEALDAKIAKDVNRGEKMTKQDPISQLPEFIRKVANGEVDVSSVLDFASQNLGAFFGDASEKISNVWAEASDNPDDVQPPKHKSEDEDKIEVNVEDFIEAARKDRLNITFRYQGNKYVGLPIKFLLAPNGERFYITVSDFDGVVSTFALGDMEDVTFHTEPAKGSRVTVNKFKVGDVVYKPSGYKFPSTVVSVFEKTNGEVRLVAEDDRGALHIFNEGQLEHFEA